MTVIFIFVVLIAMYFGIIAAILAIKELMREIKERDYYAHR